jgi:hypothetical protein
MVIPRWVVFLLAAWTFAFGGYRLYVALHNRRRGEGQLRRKGMYAMSRRRHLLFGVLYLIIGAYLTAMGFGYAIDIGALWGPDRPAPSADPGGGAAIQLQHN